MRCLADIQEEFEFLDSDDRYRMLIELGRELDPMPDALKTDATFVRGCASKVWTYPLRRDDGTLHFLADGESAFTKGVIALVLSMVQDREPKDILNVPIEKKLEPFALDRFLTKNRVLGVPGMITLIRATAERYA